jgi:hypothetical protein
LTDRQRLQKRLQTAAKKRLQTAANGWAAKTATLKTAKRLQRQPLLRKKRLQRQPLLKQPNKNGCKDSHS